MIFLERSIQAIESAFLGFGDAKREISNPKKVGEMPKRYSRCDGVFYREEVSEIRAFNPEFRNFRSE